MTYEKHFAYRVRAKPGPIADVSTPTYVKLREISTVYTLKTNQQSLPGIHVAQLTPNIPRTMKKISSYACQSFRRTSEESSSGKEATDLVVSNLEQHKFPSSKWIQEFQRDCSNHSAEEAGKSKSAITIHGTSGRGMRFTFAT